MLEDRYGLALSTSSATAVAHYVDGVDRMLAADVGAGTCFLRAIEADEGFALAHAGLALAVRPQGRVEEAQAAMQQAGTLVDGQSPRERGHVAAAVPIIAGDTARALELVNAHLRAFPRDALLLQVSVPMQNQSGRRHRREERAALMEELAPHYGDDWYFLASRSFVLQELGELETARRLAERSLARFPRAGGAAHTMAHVFYETNDHAGGVDFLGTWMADYDEHAPMYCHYAWHLALFELARGRYERASEHYEQGIRPALTRNRTSLNDAASLLWRQQLYGCATGPLPWTEVCELGARLTSQARMPFNDVHAGLAFAATGDEAALDRLTDALRVAAEYGHPVAGQVVRPLVQAAAAFAQGDYDATIRLMEPIQYEIVRVGGSNAQREVFEDTLLEAYLRAAHFDRAEAVLRQRLARRPSARDYMWLGRAQAGRGQADQAEASLRTARSFWADAETDSPELAALAIALSRIPPTQRDEM
jgi:tetratricopeptide (TPR) repeat protein